MNPDRIFKVVSRNVKKDGTVGTIVKKRIYTSLKSFEMHSPQTISRYKRTYNVGVFELINGNWEPYKKKPFAVDRPSVLETRQSDSIASLSTVVADQNAELIRMSKMLPSPVKQLQHDPDCTCGAKYIHGSQCPSFGVRKHFVFTAKKNGLQVGCTTDVDASEALMEMPKKERDQFMAVEVDEDKCPICHRAEKYERKSTPTDLFKYAMERLDEMSADELYEIFQRAKENE